MRMVVIHRLWFATSNLCTKSEDTSFMCSEDRRRWPKFRKWGCFGLL